MARKHFPKPKDHTLPSTHLESSEIDHILKAKLRPEHYKNSTVVAYIGHYMDCRDNKQASDLTGISPKEGMRIKARKDVQQAIQSITNTAVLKYGLDPGEIVEKVKSVAFSDPAEIVDADGVAITNLREIPPETRRAIKKFKVKNLYDVDPNGIKIKIGELVEVEMWDRLKASEMLGREVDLFKPTQIHQHGVTSEMKDLLLGAKSRAEREVGETLEIEGTVEDSDES